MAVKPLVPETQDHYITVAWKAIQTIAREDPGLGRVVKTMRLMDGAVDDLMPPTLAELPWMRICPLASPMNIGSESEWELGFQVGFELGVTGTAVADLLNLFGLLVTAFSQSTLMSNGRNVQEFYRGAQIRVIQFTQAAIGPGPTRVQPGSPPPPPFLLAQGVMSGQVFFPN